MFVLDCFGTNHDLTSAKEVYFPQHPQKRPGEPQRGVDGSPVQIDDFQRTAPG